MQIMTLYSQYIFSLILFTVKNKSLFTPNNKIHKYKTRNNTNLPLSTVNVTKFYKGPYISGSKAFNHLPRRKKFWPMIWNPLKHLLRDFYIIILLIQLKNTTKIMMTRTCKSYNKDCDFIWFFILLILWQSFNVLCLMLI